MTSTESPAPDTDAAHIDEPPEPPADDDAAATGDRPGWWSASPTWAKAVVAGGLVLALLLAGAVAGGLLGRDAVTTYAPPAGSVDVDFLQDMSVHHRQAVQMAVLERRTTDPELGQIAFDIESTQIMQVGNMEGWLRLWDQPTTPPDNLYMGWMGMPAASMPGMASEAELDELRTLTGRELDVRFLQLMLRHHEGGAPMLEVAAEQAEVPVVSALAAAMLRAQTAESATMRQMLAARGAAPLPSPVMDHGGMHGGN